MVEVEIEGAREIANLLGRLGEKAAQKFLEREGYTVCRWPVSFTIGKKLGLCEHIVCNKSYKVIKEKCPYRCHRRKKEHGWVELTVHDPVSGWERTHISSDTRIRCPCLPSELPIDPSGVQKLFNVCKNVCEEICLVPQVVQVCVNHQFSGMPDFLAHKNGKNYSFEVKTGASARLDEWQTTFMKKMKQLGFKTGTIGVFIERIEVGEPILASVEVKPFPSRKKWRGRLHIDVYETLLKALTSLEKGMAVEVSQISPGVLRRRVKYLQESERIGKGYKVVQRGKRLFIKHE